MKITRIKVQASINFQNVEIEAEFDEKPKPEQVDFLQKRAAALAANQSELRDEIVKHKNIKTQEKKQQYSDNKYKNNKYL